MASVKLLWAGRWYAIGDSHKEFLADKTADEDYLKLTMVAIAREHIKMDDSIIENYLRNRETAGTLDFNLMCTIDTVAHKYMDGIMRSLREHEYNPLTVRLRFMGGGAFLIRNFAQRDKNTQIIDDIHANAKGYQLLAEKALRKRGIGFEE